MLLTIASFAGPKISNRDKKFLLIKENKINGIKIDNINQLDSIVICNDNSFLISNKGLDYFLGSRISYISLGEKDLSFFKSYFLADAVNGSFLLGKNFTLNSTNAGFSSIVNMALVIKVVDNTAPIFSEGDFSSGIKLNMSYTNFLTGKISYDQGCSSTDQKGLMNNFLKEEITKRIIQKQISTNEMKANLDKLKSDRSNELNNIVQQFKKELNDAKDENRKNYLKTNIDRTESMIVENEKIYEKYNKENIEELDKNMFANLHEKESNFLETKEAFTKASVIWYTMGVSLPISKSDNYLLIDSAFKVVGDYDFRKWNFFVKLNQLIVHPKSNLLIQFSPNLYYTNNIIENKLKQDARKSFRILSNTTDTLRVKEFNEEKGYFNDYHSYFTLNLGFKFVYQYVQLDKYAIGFDIESRLSQLKKKGRLDGFIGIPVSFKGSEDKFLNFEPYVLVTDILTTNNKLDNKPKNISLGIRLGLPFSNFID